MSGLKLDGNSGTHAQGTFDGAPSSSPFASTSDGRLESGTVRTPLGLEGQAHTISVGNGHTAKSLLDAGNATVIDGEEFFDAEEAPEVIREGIEAVSRWAEEARLGTGEKRAEIQKAVERQEGFFDRLMSRLLFPGLEQLDAEDSVGGEPDTSGVSSTLATPASPAPLQVQTAKETVATKALDDMGEISREIDASLMKLDKHLRYMGLPGLTGLGDHGRLDTQELSYSDHGHRLWHQLKGALRATGDSAGQVAVAASFPLLAEFAASMLGGGAVTGLAMSVLGGGSALYSVIQTVLNFPQLAKDETAKGLINDVLEKVHVQLGHLDRMKEQEKLRQMVGERTMVVSLERNQTVNALNSELAQVERALSEKSAAAAGTSGVAQLGDGTMRGQVMDLASGVASAFRSFFAPVASACSKLLDFLVGLSNIFERAREQKAEAQREESFAAAYKHALGTLSKARAGSSASGDDVFAVMVKAGYSQSECEARLASVRSRVHMGENLAQSILESKGKAFGVVQISPEYAVPASLMLARALAWHVAVEAERSADGLSFSTALNPDGSMSVADPDGQLYNFLMSVPSAYTGTMAGLTGSEARGRMTIDDHGAGFPNGARSMQFEHALNGEGVSELRVMFVQEQPKPMFTPLVHASQAMRSLYVAEKWAQLKPGSSAQEGANKADYAKWPQAALEDRKTELIGKLSHEMTLLQIDQERFKAAQDWQLVKGFAGALSTA
ncbi:MAG: hypothetical protein WBC18_06195 [Ottowia sp.]|uniref:hypothetical protein n=1 Tax=Ottowia sp. TaxID=1898956 RepID=UPI003C76A654